MLKFIKILYLYVVLQIRYLIYRWYFSTNHIWIWNVRNLLRILNHSEFNFLCFSFGKDFNGFLGMLLKFWRFLTFFKFYIFVELVIKFRWIFLKLLIFLFKKTSFLLLNQCLKKKVLRFKELFFIFLILIFIHCYVVFFIFFFILKQLVLFVHSLKNFFFVIYKKYPHIVLIGVYTTFPVVYMTNFYLLMMVPEDMEFFKNIENLNFHNHHYDQKSSSSDSNLIKTLQLQLTQIKIEIQNLVNEHKSCIDSERQKQLLEQVRQRFGVFTEIKKQITYLDTPFKKGNFIRTPGTPFGFPQIKSNLDAVHQLPNQISSLKTKLGFNNVFSKIIKDGILAVYKKV